ncbi:putative phospholipid-binding protein MlaC [Thalassocella blandensis]|nr:putative phospholipid-binding protein MlaC [Thalassocella blandensis]
MNLGKAFKGVLALAFAVSTFATTGAFADDKAKKSTTEVKVAAVKDEVSPHKVVEDVTNQLMTIVAGGKQAMEKNPDKYFAEVQGVMEQVVDFNYIAKNVMGAKYWNSATTDQKKRFVKVFTDGLVQTYAKGMANFADFDISVMPPDSDLGDKKRVSVIQKFQGPEGVNRVAYTMGLHKSGDWKLINVVLDGVNLGETLRTQFAQSVTENKGDLDATINGWQLKS